MWCFFHLPSLGLDTTKVQPAGEEAVAGKSLSVALALRTFEAAGDEGFGEVVDGPVKDDVVVKTKLFSIGYTGHWPRFPG